MYDDDIEDRIEDRIVDVEISHEQIQQGVIRLLFYLFGSSLAMVISYAQNHSILWGIGHGILSWAYVLYFGIFK